MTVLFLKTATFTPRLLVETDSTLTTGAVHDLPADPCRLIMVCTVHHSVTKYYDNLP
jgi:hypothetical protein